MPKIKFYINYDEDLEYVLFRLTSLDPAGLNFRIKKKGLDRKVVDNILAAETEDEQILLLDDYLKKVYFQIKPELEKIKGTYIQIWEGKSNDFFKITKKLMGNLPWNFDEYYFLISAFYSMASRGRTNKLAVWYKRDPAKHYYMNAYELILSHFFETVDQLYEKRPVSDWYLWALAEIIAHILVYKEKKLILPLWSHMNKLLKTPIDKDFQSGSYPHLGIHAKKVFDLYKQTADYSIFVKESIDYIKDVPKEVLSSQNS